MTEHDVVQTLDGGAATYMGDGVWAISQADETGKVHTVAVTIGDLEAIRSAVA